MYLFAYIVTIYEAPLLCTIYKVELSAEISMRVPEDDIDSPEWARYSLIHLFIAAVSKSKIVLNKTQETWFNSIISSC